MSGKRWMIATVIIGILFIPFLFFGFMPINTSLFATEVVPGDPIINPTTYEIALIPMMDSTGVYLLNGDKILLSQLRSQWRQLNEWVTWGPRLSEPITRFVLAGKKLLRLPL